MKAVVFGIGRMGQAIAYAMDKLGYDVMGVDAKSTARKLLEDLVPNAKFFQSSDLELDFPEILDEDKPKVDIVISSLPYHQTKSLGVYCIDAGVRYCDLGGRVDVSEAIDDYAKQVASKPVMTDLGLAPGWVNILAEQGCRDIHGDATDVKMMVGGLPDYLESNKNPLRYGITWSIDGLINEYRDDCVILENGEIKIVKGMEGLEDVEGQNFGRMEAFYTSGGASHSIRSMKDRGVKNCSYKTLRYKGHRDIVKFLIRDCGLDNETLKHIFTKGCGFADKDEVLVLAEVKGGDKTWRQEKVIKADKKFSAMQKATAFPISSVAALMAKGTFDGKKDQHRDYYTHFEKALSYKDIPFDEFYKNLITLGLES
jgi:saccharopine dehydrogenase-like NADP-dependent oxidoreductase